MKPGLWKKFWFLAKPYWKSEKKFEALSLLIASLALALGMVYFQYLLTQWNQEFYDSIQKADQTAFFKAIKKFGLIAVGFILVAMYNFYLGQVLRMNWRKWLTEIYLKKWLGNQTYYFWQISGGKSDNPDQRIAEDIRDFVDHTVNLFLMLFRNIISLVTFSIMLWSLSGPLQIALGSKTINIPGYMLWTCLVYAFVGSLLTQWIGRKLVPLNYEQQKFEAEFRYGLVRLRENAESVAMIKGDAAEEKALGAKFLHVLTNFKALIDKQKQLTFSTTFYDLLASIFPILVAAPRYFAKEITMGQIFQIAGAFSRVKDSLSFFIDAYTSIAHWQAVVHRLYGFTESIELANELRAKINSKVSNGNNIEISGLSPRLPDNKILFSDFNFTAASGEAHLIKGKSGKGKSTLLRIITKIWPYFEGQINVPQGATILALPQKPYLPIGSLAESMSYPADPSKFSDEEYCKSLDLCRLEHLKDKLHVALNWSQVLSPGEQQRLSFARAFLARPDILFLDEATSALDEDTQAYLYGELRKQLPKSIILSIAHRNGVSEFHDQTIEIK